MRLDAIMDEVAQVLEAMTGLRVTPHPPATISPPAGYVSYPEDVQFDTAYGRGEDMITGLPIVLLVGKATDRSARDTVARWADGDGPDSLKAAFDAHPWRSCDDLQVTNCKFDVETIGAVPYLAAMFTATAVGTGED